MPWGPCPVLVLSPLSSCTFPHSLLRSTDPKPRQFRSGLWVCPINVLVWNPPLLLSMYSLAAPVRIRPTRAQSQAGLFIFPCPALPTQHCMAGIQVPPCSPNSTALPRETHISHSSEHPPKPPEEQVSPAGVSKQDSVGSTHSTPLRQRLLFPTKTLHIPSQSCQSSAPTRASK